MSPGEARALAMAYELSQLLFTLRENRDNPRVDAALDLIDGAIDELDALVPVDHGRQSGHSLRLLVTDPSAYDAERVQGAIRSFLNAKAPQRGVTTLRLVDRRFR
jgi:hypothetical protein